jgi:cellulose synthase/poly-beta-1,6-N-acetylglucosamine synthase-like glycosyltransferase
VRVYERPSYLSSPQLPRVSIVVPLFRERRRSIERTLDSLRHQSYPRDLMEVLLVVDEDDEATLNDVMRLMERVGDLNAKVLVNARPRRRMKAFAMNTAIRHAAGDVVGFYDADDIFPRDQVLSSVLLMIERNYAAVGTRVYRYRRGILGRLVYLETIIWYDGVVPFLRTVVGITPLSGEGLFIRRSVLSEVPLSLAEDALISLRLQGMGYRVGLLDSYVYELAPSSITSLIRQRLRWNRGYVQNLLVMMRNDVDLVYKVRVALFYLLTASPPAMLIITTMGFNYTMYMVLTANPDIEATLYIASTILSTNILTLYVARSLMFNESATLGKIILLLPAYWFLVGSIALVSPLVPVRGWLKTTR